MAVARWLALEDMFGSAETIADDKTIERHYDAVHMTVKTFAVFATMC
jgi:hypothetical protein